ncbi:MAG: radical SAM family heme chaperone HemW [Clostridia bacterium]|nr:radical SAM family heme chaperone HemW [Clostridia bacterium]
MNGIYIHIPFCNSKCPYCDFYSYRCKEDERRRYVDALIDEIKTLRRVGEFAPKTFEADTLYLGGGTPSVMSGEDICRIVEEAKLKFNMPPTSEITIECNPNSHIEDLIPYFKKCGINRVSLGMQSAVDTERRALGRQSDKKRIAEVIKLLKDNGIDNISLDIMLGIPSQTKESLKETLDFVINCNVKHVSAYILKIEDGTFFDTHRERYLFPDENETCDLYSLCAEALENADFTHYEISNFAIEGYESRHNTKYWELENYLGIGAAAHSFVDGKRFYFESDTEGFINGNKVIFDGNGGDCDEYIMLKLRLKKGLDIGELKKIYGEAPAEKITKKAPLFKEQGLVNFDGNHLSLTKKGFLLSNSIIAELI